jgi:hypothetical protein
MESSGSHITGRSYRPVTEDLDTMGSDRARRKSHPAQSGCEGVKRAIFHQQVRAITNRKTVEWLSRCSTTDSLCSFQCHDMVAC